MYLGAIEAGGTKFNCAIGTEQGHIIKETRIPTSDPARTLDQVIQWFKSMISEGYQIGHIGVGSFGPVDLRVGSDTWGFITSTPKPGWKMTDLAGSLRKSLDVKVSMDTDVNTAALWESRNGSAKGLNNVVYYTIGTGIGGGAVLDGKLLHGLLHPEMGHAFIKRHPDDKFKGSCPFHGDCAEGLASGPAVEKRWGMKGEEISFDHEAWKLEAWYIGQIVVNTQMMISPEAIVLGGGILQVKGMIDMVRSSAWEQASGYLAHPGSRDEWIKLLREPSVDKPGLQGALLLAAGYFHGE